MRFYVEVDKKHKRLRKNIYHFKPKDVDVVEVNIKDGELFDFKKYSVEKKNHKWVLVEKKKGGKK